MNCKNCDTLFSDDADYCPNCGGKVIRNRLTLKALFSDFSEQFLNYDNKFLKTFLHLFSKPETVIDGYISGTRKRYVNVISYFAIAITVTGLQVFILQKFFPESMKFSSMIAKGQEELMGDIMKSTMEYTSIIMMLYIPIYALMSKIVFFNTKKYNYTEHLVLFMYLQAQMSIFLGVITILLVIFGVNYMELSFYLLPIMIIYSAYCLKRIYKLSLKKIIIKTLLFIFVLLITYIAFSVFFGLLYLIYMFLTGELQELVNTQKELS